MTPKPFLLPFLFLFGTWAASAEGDGGAKLGHLGHGPTIPWNPANITLLGDASIKNGSSVILTSGGSGYRPVAGRAFYSRPLRFLEPTTRSPASFASRFTFSIDPSPSFGDGLAFFVTSDPLCHGAAGGYLGLFPDVDAQSGGSYGSAALPYAQEDGGEESVTISVEFDTRLDADDNRVALNVGSIFSVAAAEAADAGVDLRAGIPTTAWVEYIASEATARVWLAYSQSRPPRPLLVARFNLSGLFRDFMYVGFSASNGPAGAAIHAVHHWSFRTFGFGIAASVSPAGVGAGEDGGECSTCSPHGQYDGGDVAFSLGGSSPGRTRILLVVGLATGGALLFLLISTIAITAAGWYLSGNCEEENDEQEQEQEPSGRAELEVPVRIPLGDIKLATNGFHCSKILGQGSSAATVYEGVLPSGCKIAVKRFTRAEQYASAFATEIATAIGSLRHRNLVPFKGWCCEKDELMLAYEYMLNGSLDKLLHPAAPPGFQTNAAPSTLSWDIRWKIVLGVASAVAFLHEECEKKIIHRDVKTSNVLLDAEFNAKLGGLGVAELDAHRRTLKATLGYLAPEYIHSGVATEKSDMYSFGVVALEVATGRRPVDRDGITLVDWVWALWGRRRLAKAADPRLENRFSMDEMSRVLVVGLCCAHPECRRRPAMRKAMRMLQGGSPLPTLPPQRPAIRLLPHMPPASQDESSQISQDDNTSWFTACSETGDPGDGVNRSLLP